MKTEPGWRMLKFERAKFLLSALHPSEFPRMKDDKGRPLIEIAIAGRSNVGKSTLINALFKTKSLAKASNTPGKTQRILFFLIDESALLVDLPGYGYAKAPKEEIQSWSQAIDEYLNHRETLKLVLLLVDIRREPSKEDRAMMEWAAAKQIPLLVIFTKRDKLNKSDPLPPHGFPFSSREPEDRKRLIRKINELL